MRLRPSLWCLVVSLPLAATGCVVVSSDDGDDDSETSSSGDGDGDGDGDPGDGDGDGSPGDGDGDGDGAPGDGDGDGDGAPGDGDGDGDGDADCGPPDPSVDFTYAPFDFGVGEPWDTDISLICTVTEADTSNGLYMVLDCDDAPDPVVIDISATPTFLPPVFGGETLDIRYIYEGPWWFNLYLRIDMVGYGHLLTLIDGDSLVPEQPYEFDPGVPMTPHYDLCTPFDDGCGDLERLALDFEINGEMASMMDSSYAIVGGDPGTDVWVAEAGHLHDIQCTDTPDEWYRVLIANTGWE